MDMQRLIDTEMQVLNSGVWGTIGKYSVSAAKALAEYSGAKFGLLCHSYDAAYEAVLRHFGARFGVNQTSDATVVGEVSAPSDSLVAVCVNSTPVFADVCDTCGMIKPKLLADLLESLDDFSIENQDAAVHRWIEEKGYGMGEIMNAFRLALVGEGKGPQMFDISGLIGKEETLQRLRRAIEVLG